MSRIHHGALTILVMGLLVSGASARDRKGRVMSDTTTLVTLNAEGRPVVGGKFGLEIKPTPKGVLLAIRVCCQDNGPPMVRYLAYPTERGPAVAVRVVAEPGPGCYWTQQRGSRTPKFSGFILEEDTFKVKEGPFKSFELRQDEKKRLVLDEQRTPHRKDSREFVGRTIKYDDLDDGP